MEPGAYDKTIQLGDLQRQFPQFPGDQHLAMLHASARAELIRMLWYPPLDVLH